MIDLPYRKKIIPIKQWEKPFKDEYSIEESEERTVIKIKKVKKIKNSKLISALKEEVAIEHGYFNEEGSAWDYAMLITYRKVEQLKLYEKVIEKALIKGLGKEN